MRIAPLWAGSSQTRRVLLLAVAAVLTPAGVLRYHRFVRQLQGDTLYVHPPGSTLLYLYMVLVALIGGLAVLGWVWELRAAPIIAVAGFLVWPWYYFPQFRPVGDIVVLFVAVLAVTGVEGILRFPDRVGRMLFVEAAGVSALSVGVLHFLLGFALQVYVRELSWVDLPPLRLLTAGIVTVVCGLGLVATGALPVIFWSHYRLVTPTFLTAGWFVWGVYGIWTRSGLPLSAFSGIRWTALRPHPDYLLQWTMLMVGLLVLASGELAVQKARRVLLTLPRRALDR